MQSTIDKFVATLQQMGSDITVHRESGGTDCPCRTIDGYRDPAYHVLNTDAEVCNENGVLADVAEFVVKGSCQPAVTQYTRPSQRATDVLGDAQRDDRIFILPIEWEGNVVDLYGWDDSGSDYLVYDGRRYSVVSADKLPDVDGSPHHWEAGARLLTGARPS